MALKIYTFPQGSEQWDNIRKSKLTASKVASVVCGETSKYVSVARVAEAEEIDYMMTKAEKQWEVYEKLTQTNFIELKLLNASGVKGLKAKGLINVSETSNTTRLSAGASKHIDRLIVEKLYTSAELGERPPTDAMDRGTELEPLARYEFEQMTGIDVAEVGFVIDPELATMVGCSPDGVIWLDKVIISGLETKCPLPQTHLTYSREGVLPTDYKLQVHTCMAVTGAKSWWFMSYCPGLPTFLILVERDEYTENLCKTLQDFASLYWKQNKEYLNKTDNTEELKKRMHELSKQAA